jgi:hypothetical protein
MAATCFLNLLWKSGASQKSLKIICLPNHEMQLFLFPFNIASKIYNKTTFYTFLHSPNSTATHEPYHENDQTP